MQTVILQLMNEHRFIEQALGALGAHVSGDTPERLMTAEFADFFSHYADVIHHGKEEAMLFREMEKAGFQRLSGPLAVMLFEHGQGREAVGALAELGRGSGISEAEEKQRLRDVARDYNELLQNHIIKEDRILYPLAMKTIPEKAMALLDAEAEAFDAKTRASGELDRLTRLGHELVIRNPVKCATVANWTCNILCHA